MPRGKSAEQRAADQVLKNRILQLYGRGGTIVSSDGSNTVQTQNSATSGVGSSSIPGAPEVSIHEEEAEESDNDGTTDEEVATFPLRETPRKEGPQPKARRGLVCGKQTAETVRRNGGTKIPVDFDPAIGGSTSKAVWSALSHDLGAAVRNYVPMLKPSWNELDVDAKLQAYTAVSVFYDLRFDEYEGLFEALDKMCCAMYSRWKCRIHTRWEKAQKEGQETALPKEFRKRKAEWNYLKAHFNEEKYRVS